MNKRLIVICIIAFLLLTAGIIAVTQEAEYYIDISETDSDIFLLLDEEDEEEYVPPYKGYIYAREIPQWVKPIRWFRSNLGGLVIQEMSSRLAALRNEYALSVDFAEREELPDELLPFYNDDNYIEVRKLYKYGIQIRTQWIFRDLPGAVKLVSVFSENDEQSGFIEIYNEDGLLSQEYIFEEDKETRVDFVFNEGLLINSKVYVLANTDGTNQFELEYIDSFLYNRAKFLRAVERKYYKDNVLDFSSEPVRVTMPNTIKDAVNDRNFIGARYNTLPEFFGSINVGKDFKMVYVTDERSRILSQTLYDEEDNVVYVITNTWRGDRIVSTSKTEGDTVLAASYEYDSAGNRIRERNTKNGVLERVVRTEGKTEIEELYIEGVIVLRAVWEDGRKISETRIRNN